MYSKKPMTPQLPILILLISLLLPSTLLSGTLDLSAQALRIRQILDDDFPEMFGSDQLQLLNMVGAILENLLSPSGFPQRLPLNVQRKLLDGLLCFIQGVLKDPDRPLVETPDVEEPDGARRIEAILQEIAGEVLTDTLPRPVFETPISGGADTKCKVRIGRREDGRFVVTQAFVLAAAQTLTAQGSPGGGLYHWSFAEVPGHNGDQLELATASQFLARDSDGVRIARISPALQGEGNAAGGLSNLAVTRSSPGEFEVIVTYTTPDRDNCQARVLISQ